MGAWPRRGSWIAAAALGVLAATGSAGMIFDKVLQARAFAEFPPPGRILDAGTARLHLLCEGPKGAATLVLEAGGGDISTVWRRVQPQLARTHRVCSYDRAGQGWSGVSTSPRRPEVIARELHAVLAEAGEDAPYVLVGHSIGGIYARTFAQTYPGETVALVLLDSSVDGVEGAPTPPAVDMAEISAMRLIRPFVPFGVVRLLFGASARTGDPPDPAEAALRLRASAFLANYEGLSQVRAGRSGPPPVAGVLGDRPVVVITSRGPLKGLERFPLWAQAEVGRYRPLYQAAQGQLARLSTCSVQLFADRSGHNIHLDQPDLVISAIEAVAPTAGPKTPCAASTLARR